MTAARQKSKAKPTGDPQAFAQAAECLRTLAHPVTIADGAAVVAGASYGW